MPTSVVFTANNLWSHTSPCNVLSPHTCARLAWAWLASYLLIIVNRKILLFPFGNAHKAEKTAIHFYVGVADPEVFFKKFPIAIVVGHFEVRHPSNPEENKLYPGLPLHLYAASSFSHVLLLQSFSVTLLLAILIGVIHWMAVNFPSIYTRAAI